MADVAADHNMVLWQNLAKVSQTLLHLTQGNSDNLDHYYEADASHALIDGFVCINSMVVFDAPVSVLWDT